MDIRELTNACEMFAGQINNAFDTAGESLTLKVDHYKTGTTVME